MTPRSGLISIALAASLALTLVPVAPAAAAPAPGEAPGQVAVSKALPEKKSKAKKATLKISIGGLPKKTKAKVKVTGPTKKSLTKTTSLKVKAGSYTVTAKNVTKSKKTYYPNVTSWSVGLGAGKKGRLTITYGRKPPASAPQFRLRGGVGLALRQTTGSPSVARQLEVGGTSNLVTVQADGSTVLAVSGITVTVDQFFVAPNGDVYLVMNSNRFSLDTGEYVERACRFARVPVGSERAQCVEADIGISQLAAGPYGGPGTPPVQFDDASNVYYTGYPLYGNTAGFMLRKSVNGQVSNLVNSSAWVSSFLVLGNGSVFVSGSSNSQAWVRRINSQGGLETVASGSLLGFLQLLPDGHVYFGDYEGIRRYLTDQQSLDPSPWVASSGPSNTPHAVCADLFPPGVNCPISFQSPLAIVTTANGHTVLVPGPNTVQGGWLLQIGPTPAALPTQIKDVGAAVAGGNKIYLAGTKANGHQALVALDPATGAEQVLIDQDREVEIYHLTYSASRNVLMFDGQRFADNASVIGSVAVGNGEATMTPSTSRFSALRAWS